MSAGARANAAAARAMVEELAAAGVREACICPGSRSTPLALALVREPLIRCWSIVDERSAAYFALGIARSSWRPTVVLSTSGTAAANFLPAVAEAYLSEVPLVVITADRPPELRDCAAPQTIRQPGLFGSHVRWAVDAAVPEAGADLDAYFRTLACRAAATSTGAPAGPVHVNVPLREPLIDDSVIVRGDDGDVPDAGGRRPRTYVHAAPCSPSTATVERLAAVLASEPRGVVVCGARSLRAEARTAIVELAAALGWPILADPLSGLRYGAHDASGVIDAYDVLVRCHEFEARHAPDAVLRIGPPPTSKALARFLSASGVRHHVVVASPGTWPDPGLEATEMVHAEAATLCRELAARVSLRKDDGWLPAWQRCSAAVREALAPGLAADDELFEGGVSDTLLEGLPDSSLLYVGNSLPVRHLDTFTACRTKRIEAVANRGANGIDGVLSTALGAAAVAGRPTALVVGDLSFLHDLGGLQIAARYDLKLLVVLINNDGGGIFSFLPQAELSEQELGYFTTPHGLDVEPAVRMCGASFERVASRAELADAIESWAAAPRLSVIEVPTDKARTVSRQRELVEAALSRLRSGLEEAACA